MWILQDMKPVKVGPSEAVEWVMKHGTSLDIATTNHHSVSLSFNIAPTVLGGELYFYQVLTFNRETGELDDLYEARTLQDAKNRFWSQVRFLRDGGKLKNEEQAEPDVRDDSKRMAAAVVFAVFGAAAAALISQLFIQ